MKIQMNEAMAKLFLNKEVLDHMRKQFLFKTLVEYVIDWRYKSTRVNLQKWLAECTKDGALPSKLVTVFSPLKYSKASYDSKMKQILAYVEANYDYVGDQENWKVEEKWQTPQETQRMLEGDCEDGAVLIYAIAKFVGIPDDYLRIVAGDVYDPATKGTVGHCYVCYTSIKDGLEYPLDWCYWFDKSIPMTTPYVLRDEYFGGEKEWFSVNSTESFKCK